MERMPANGVEIAYVASGSGEPVVLIHGGESSHAQYDTVRPLLGAGIRAIAYDQRDTGESRNAAAAYDLADLARDCAALITGLGYEKAHVFGASYGGAIALQLAVTVPEVVRTLTVGATFPHAASTPGNDARRVLALPPEERTRQMLGLLLSEKGQESAELVAEARAVLFHRAAEADARRTAAIRTYDVADQLSAITAPTMLIYGEDDQLAAPSMGREIASGIPGAQLVVLPELRHGITLEGKNSVATLLREFVLAHPIEKED
ncbi:alpha/beta fold hydrolase [Amycolatopsis jejuensis]|uniref:alpha/beta fold hydrolase n=1 Tax=Amycolatopsis jejuensis TaxID=330084 RepID=UPI000524628F|nr:alpha/beta hydrolase [Amycolatopsis jejuensis]